MFISLLPAVSKASGCCFLLLSAMTGFAQQDFSAIEIKAIQAGGVVKMLSAENGFGGGNVAASVGKDGILLVDNMYEAVTPKIIALLKDAPDTNIRFVVNTHFHSDHIQGNKVFSGTAAIIAHENVLKRLKAKAGQSTSSLPDITFNKDLNIYFNGEEIQLFHLPNGHTDSDVFVYFTQSKVIHMGDTFFNGMFPAVYKEGGGDMMQLIKNLEQVLQKIPADAAVIPGHGPLATKKDLESYLQMLKETTSLVSTTITAGKTLQQAIAEKLLDKYDALGSGGAQTTEQYLAMLYKLLLP